MRDEELGRARVSKYTQHSSFQNLFHNRLEQMPAKRERTQITINAVIEHTIALVTELSTLIRHMGRSKWKFQN